MLMKLLVGYGNTLRQDDGVGCVIAARLAPIYVDSGVRVIITPQILPELAADIARSACVVFVDAAIEGSAGSVQVRTLTPLSHMEDAHALTSPGILLFARMLYDSCPPAHLVTITGSAFGLGETLSPPVQNALPQAIAKVRLLIDRDRVTPGEHTAGHLAEQDNITSVIPT